MRERIIKTEEELNRLTGRELQVQVLMVQGLGNKDIATELNISFQTVKNHIHHIFEKTGLTRYEIIAYGKAGT
jgi:two-component system nitrate/nitrite response regulator NarL